MESMQSHFEEAQNISPVASTRQYVHLKPSVAIRYMSNEPQAHISMTPLTNSTLIMLVHGDP